MENNCLQEDNDGKKMFTEIHIPGFLKTGWAKISAHSTTWQFRQFKTIKLIQRPMKSL